MYTADSFEKWYNAIDRLLYQRDRQRLFDYTDNADCWLDLWNHYCSGLMVCEVADLFDRT